ncbi:hypothetical protein D9619_012951 [Psilocybe cf. subviscida]|uniref:Protein-S-isoprenylcysteine O-methyltransferase n=1 Tax=Psilocybe cf. subviscida TaxID=2480587 RepID=A0A8H5BIJ2_9AGAR|nr:hypothetical protein D9619_012951 [Psilocybe cf. subviscida]
MSLRKIPLILAFNYALKRSLTPPNPPPPDEALIQKSSFRKWYSRVFLKFYRKVEISVALLEILSILIYNYPKHPLLQHPFVARISSLLLSKINAGAIHPSTVGNIGAGMMITGALIRVLAYRYLGRLFTFSLSIHKDHYLVTSGPYGIVRHPGYTGLLIANSGWFLWHLSRGSFFMSGLGLERTLLGKAAVGVWGLSTMGGILYATLGRLKKEDDVIKKEFGKEWEEWARRVPYMLIPGIY